MAEIAPIKVRFDVDTSGLKGINSAIDNLGSGNNGITKKMGILGVAAGTALGNGISRVAGAAMNSISNIIDAGINQALEQGKLEAKTAAVIKSTGGAAGVSAQQMTDLADSIEGVTGAQIDALDILNGENVLATFTNIKNVAGQGNDIFTQTTQSATDLSAALGQDMQSSVMQLGKALNDPIKGVSALQRVGVSFTESQKKQIEALVKTGDTMGAQKVILAEINKEFGGAAAALGGTDAAKISSAMDTIQDAIAGVAAKLAPTIGKLATQFSDKLGPAIEKSAPMIEAVFGFLANNIDKIIALAGVLGTLSAGVKTFTILQGALNIVMAMNPIGAVIAAVGLLIAGIVYLATQTTIFQDAFKELGRIGAEIGKFFQDLFGGISDFFGGIGKFLTGGTFKADVKSTTTAANSGGGNVTNTYNVQAQGLTVDAVTKDAKRRGNLKAPVGGNR